MLTGLTNQARVAREEIFGPVVTVIEFDDADEALDDRQRQPVRPRRPTSGPATSTRRCAWPQGIRAGQVYVNATGVGTGVELPFGGYKHSGWGREKGLEALASYTADEERLHRVR